MRFEKHEGKKKPLHVADQILKATQEGDIKPGDKLPPENELAELTGVSRASVREALAALRVAEILETRAGDGTYFKGFKNMEDIRTKLLETLSKNRRPLQLQEAREAFEIGIMKSATEKFGMEDEARMRRILNQMEEAAENNNYEKFIEYHKEFHMAIAKATENVVIEETVMGFTEIMDQRLWRDLEQQYYLPKKKEYLEESIEIHTRIFEALAKGDPDHSTKQMRQHFDRYS